MNLLRALVIVVVGATGVAQDQPAAARSARISGVVFAADTGRPLEGAVVQLTFYDPEMGSSATERTDASGAFEFPRVPVGSYTLRAASARYLSWTYGQRRVDDAPALTTLREGQHLEAEIALPRLGAISGRVLDPFGDPVPGLGVFVFREEEVEGANRLVVAGRRIAPQLTDDLGQFRVHGLPPGEYYLGALSGVLTASPLFNNPNEGAGFAPTYFPSTTSIAEAKPLSLGLSQDLNEVTIAAIPAPTRRISGVVVDSTGAPLARALMSLSPADQGSVNVTLAGRTQALADGTFTFSNVPPGSYVLQARSLGTTNAFSGEFGWTIVSVNETDVTDARVSTSGPSSIRGRIVFAGAEASLSHQFSVQIAAPPAELDKEPVIAIATGDPPLKLASDGTFELGGLWGRRMIRLRRGPGEWRLERITVGGKDVTDIFVDFTARNYTSAEIVLTNRSATVSGRAVDGQGRPARGCRVMVFSADEDRWTPHSRFVALAPVAADGVFRVNGLPPGDYLTVVVPPRAVSPTSAAFLRSVRSVALPLSLPEGETKAVELTVTGQPAW